MMPRSLSGMGWLTHAMTEVSSGDTVSTRDGSTTTQWCKIHPRNWLSRRTSAEPSTAEPSQDSMSASVEFFVATFRLIFVHPHEPPELCSWPCSALRLLLLRSVS